MPSWLEEFLEWLSIIVILAVVFAIAGFLIGPTNTTPVNMGEPAYDPACVIETSTAGCVDEATYDEAVQAEAEREDAAADDGGYGDARHGWP